MIPHAVITAAALLSVTSVAMASAWSPLAASGVMSGEVITTTDGGSADVLLLRGGAHAGHRPGMSGVISRGGYDLSEVIITEVRPAHSAALITRLAPGAMVLPGDLFTVKIRSL